MVNDKELRSDREKASSFIQMYAEINKLKLNKKERALNVKVNQDLNEYSDEEN